MRPLALALALLASLLAAACSSGSAASDGRPASPTKTLQIVAGENFWGSIVSQLAGQAGHVTSVVSDPAADPHNYESSADDARAFAQADYVVINGAGYDAWAEKLLTGNPSAKRRVLTVADLLGKKEGDNPHFWYNPDDIGRVVDQVIADLKSIDGSQRSTFDTQRPAFNNALGPLRARLATIKAKFSGTPVASTESIFVYLADYLGLPVRSPTEFMNAVDEGNDPPAPSVVSFQDLLSSKRVKVLVYNRQTATNVTTNIKRRATQLGIPIVGVTETIQPPGANFQDWFEAQLLALQDALSTRGPTGG